MPRKAFIADLATASENPPSRMSGVARGGDDGDLNFIFTPLSDGPPIELSALALDVSEYPSGNTWMLYARSSVLPNGVEAALQDLAPASAGSTVTELLSTISSRLQNVLATGSQSDPLDIEDGSDMEMFDGQEDESDTEEEDYPEDYSDLEDGPRRNTSSTTSHSVPQDASKLNRRIKADLRAVRFAGFKIGILKGLTAESRTSILSISIKASKLGLSEEALQAWDLESNEYIVLLIRYSDGYRPFETIITQPAKSNDVQFRIGVSKKYKPTVLEALAAFTEIKKTAHKTANDHDADDQQSTAGFGSLFISSSLNEFINQEFLSLLKIRHGMGIGWAAAKLFFNDKQGRVGELKLDSKFPQKYYAEEEPSASLPPIIAADHIIDNNSATLSFPLIAAQFSMRYLLRCTEFCLVCHDKIEGGFEALKPYVCSKPLCLYQYMSLGFGPSVEHEIITQPYVVDLLVSFCYSAAYSRRLREYPTGMSLLVPPVRSKPP